MLKTRAPRECSMAYAVVGSSNSRDLEEPYTKPFITEPLETDQSPPPEPLHQQGLSLNLLMETYSLIAKAQPFKG
eukprot:1153929-Pelagomonas_calceolata.AAC.3